MSRICLKILFAGDSSVGKTSLLLKYVDGNFSETHMSTIGVEYKDKIININGKEINLQIWDTSGQERYQSITKNFYRNADGILFIFDLTNQESFNHIKNWLTTSEDCKKDFKKILVGNKSDLIYERKVSEEIIEKFAERKQMKYLEASAKDGTNVDRIFKEMTKLILANKTDEEIQEKFTIGHRSLKIAPKDNHYGFDQNKCC